MQVLTLFSSFPRRVPSLRGPWRTVKNQAWVLAYRLLGALVRRLARLAFGAMPDTPTHGQRSPTPLPALLTAVDDVVDSEPVARTCGNKQEPDQPLFDAPRVDGAQIGTVIARLQRTGDERLRTRALAQTLADLEQVIVTLRRISVDVEGLERTHLQIQRLADPDTDCTGFELNLAWMLLERELQLAAGHLP